jgi:hypothetical protein
MRGIYKFRYQNINDRMRSKEIQSIGPFWRRKMLQYKTVNFFHVKNTLILNVVMQTIILK